MNATEEQAEMVVRRKNAKDHGITGLIIEWAGPVHRLRVAGEEILFEWHDYLGPQPIRHDRSERRLGPRHDFWRAVSLWRRQGARIVDGLCVWDEPAPPTYRHMGGRNYLIVHAGDADWEELGSLPSIKLPRLLSEPTDPAA